SLIANSSPCLMSVVRLEYSSFRGIALLVSILTIYTCGSSISITRILFESVTYRSEEHTSELQSRFDLVCRLLLEKKKKHKLQHSQLVNKTSSQTTLTNKTIHVIYQQLMYR